MISSKADRDRIRQQRAAKRKINDALADQARRIIKDYLQGRAAISCMDDLKQAAK